LSPVIREIRTVAPRQHLANCLFALGRHSEAAAEYERALGEDPASRPLRLDYARFLSHTGQSLEALKLLNALTGEAGSDPAAWQVGGHIALRLPELREFALEWTGEALRFFPEDPLVRLQRAEACVLNGGAAEALTLLRSTPSSRANSCRALIALCELITGATPLSSTADSEPDASRAFVGWYRKLVEFGASESVAAVNANLTKLASVLPTAARLLQCAVAQAEDIRV
jgi:tetratricopeptide (TPR) repeat protein